MTTPAAPTKVFLLDKSQLKGRRMAKQCSAAPAPNGVVEQVGGKTVVGESPFVESAATLRSRGVELAQAGKLRAAVPFFLAAVAVSPGDPQTHSDEGVTWMRLQEWAPSWGAFKRALALDPANPTSLDNKRQLIGFLSNTADGRRIMEEDLANPKHRPPRPREHTVLPIRRLSQVPTERGWWQQPFILPELRGRRRRERAANASSLEQVGSAERVGLVRVMPNGHGRGSRIGAAR